MNLLQLVTGRMDSLAHNLCAHFVPHLKSFDQDVCICTLAHFRDVRAQGPQDWRWLDQQWGRGHGPDPLPLWCWTAGAEINAGWGLWSRAGGLKTEYIFVNGQKTAINCQTVFYQKYK